MNKLGVVILSSLLSVPLAFLVAVFVFGVFATITNASTNQSEARMSVTPASGKVPLSIKATIYAESQLLCTAFELDWGDNSPVEDYDPGVYDSNCYGGKFNREFTHTYTTQGIFTIRAKAGAAPIEELSTMNLAVTVHSSDWSGDLATTTQQVRCFISPNVGYAPFIAAAYVPLGGQLCDGTYEYFINWGDGYRSESRYCSKTVNHYDTFYHEYSSSADYTANIQRNHSSVIIEPESCKVYVTEGPKLKITRPDWGGTAVIGKPFNIEWDLQNPPTAKSGIEPTIRLTFVTLDGSIGFIADVDTSATSYQWTPTKDPCLEGVCQSSISNGDYYIQASLIYDTCDGDPFCGEEIPVVATSRSVSTISVRDTGIPISSWLYTVHDRLFAYPLVSQAPSIINFTTVLNSEASCAGGIYVIEYGDGESSSQAFPQGKCAAFASSFSHTYTTPGVYPIILYKNGVESTRMHITVNNPLVANSATSNLASAWEAFVSLLVKAVSF